MIIYSVSEVNFENPVIFIYLTHLSTSGVWEVKGTLLRTKKQGCEINPQTSQ